MDINVQNKTRSELLLAATLLFFRTLIVINSETLIQDINFFFANEEKY